MPSFQVIPEFLLFRKSTLKMFGRSVRQLSNSQRMESYDIVISGGGMVGSTMALALGKTPAFKDYKIALVEASSKKSGFRKASNEYSNRVSAINPSSRELFENLGAWERIRRYQVVRDMKVWGSYTGDTINYRDETGSKNVAYIVENDAIVDAVSEELECVDNVDVLYDSKITKICMKSPSHSDSHVVLDNGDSCRLQLLIGADGANSRVRDSMGVQYISYNYNQTGVVATLNILEQENVSAWQRFLPTGPIALLPLSDTESSLVWSTTHDHAKTLLSLTPQSFVDAVNEAFSSKPIDDPAVDFMKSIMVSVMEPGKVPSNCPHVTAVKESSRAAFPLGFGHATNYVKPGIAIIGDAAHKVHPLAGQGVNLGFRDIQNLTTALSYGLSRGRCVGDVIDLKRYEQASQCANVPIMAAIDLIYRVYTSDIGVVRAIGSLGIQLTEGLSPIKNIMRRVASS